MLSVIMAGGLGNEFKHVLFAKWATWFLWCNCLEVALAVSNSIFLLYSGAWHKTILLGCQHYFPHIPRIGAVWRALTTLGPSDQCSQQKQKQLYFSIASAFPTPTIISLVIIFKRAAYISLSLLLRENLSLHWDSCETPPNSFTYNTIPSSLLVVTM